MVTQVRLQMLVADGEPSVREALGEWFGSDYEVVAVRDAEEALRAVDATQGFDCALVDAELPGGGGLALCRRLKSHVRAERTPVLLLSREASEVKEVEGLDAGAVDYVQKPLRPAILRARVAAQVALKRQADHWAAQALTDPLTGLANRRHFLAAVSREWRRALRHSTPLGLILLDIDDFKRFNDRYGHPAGDECLVRVARALEGAAGRSADLVARLGGEEFGILLADSDAPGIERVAERAGARVAALAIPHDGSRAAPWVTVSRGWVTTIPSADLAARELFDTADQELYAAKRAGRARSSGRILSAMGLSPFAFGIVPSFGSGLAYVGL